MIIATTKLGRRRKSADGIFKAVCFGAAALACAFLVLLIVLILRDGVARLSPAFFSSFPSRVPKNAGIFPAMMGSLWVIGLTILFAVPIGVAAAIYLEEFTKKTDRLSSFIQLNIANLAGVPSIVYGLLGLAIFVRFLAFDRSIIAGALTMTLLILPTIIVVSQEALRAVPKSLREGALAVGATPWTAVSTQVLPAALPGITTGIILSISRAIGESAPLITIGAVVYISKIPSGIFDKFTVLPIQIFDWSSRPQPGYHEAAAGGIIALLVVLVVMNAAAIYIRAKASKKLKF